MIRTGIALLAILGGFLGWILLSLLLLLYGNDWWLSGLITLTIFAWLAGLLVAMFQQGRLRVAATGAVIAAGSYWLLALGPWFGTNVGPTLLTTRGLAQVDLWLHGPPQQTAAITWASPYSQPVYVSGSGVINAGMMPTGGPNSFAFVNTTLVPAGGSVFQPLGHWLLIWFCAGIGACAALMMQMGAKKKPPAAQQGESPFAPMPNAVSPPEPATPSPGAAA